MGGSLHCVLGILDAEKMKTSVFLSVDVMNGIWLVKLRAESPC